ncbi:MAG: hypothetical protein A2X88_09005 [Deltaproteobacteria bacterium GWC2_65_14]|nr:MAG: hypothetical protein A2X88_09005 [Deltaproteobacteria bacterium GWC2_65_14]
MEVGSMKRFSMRLGMLGTFLFLAVILNGCGTSGNREGQVGTSQTSSVVVQKGDPVLAAAPGYAGSGACAACHPNQFAGWGKSLHNAPLKTVAELGDGIFVNDADGNGVNDFKDGLDFNDPATDAIADSTLKGLRPNAPILSFSGGKYYTQLGPSGTKFEIQRTQGGNGLWKQRYHTRVGRSYYVSPVQYQEKTKVYVNYNASHWYSGTTPRYTAAYGSDNLVVQFGALGVAGTNGTQRSWENRCAGCHQTGLAVKAETTNYGGTGVQEAVTGYSELNIGCENCHGPGAAHAASRNARDIINPANFEALGVTGKRFANQVCGACHHRGEGNATILSGTSPLGLEYPARFVSGVVQLPLPGDSVIDNSAGNPFVLLNIGTAYYGTASADFGAGARAIYSGYRNWYADYPRFPIYVASRQHHQQWTDVEQGPHAADTGGLTCWDCHDPHEGKGDHQVRNTVTVAGTTLYTNNDDNTLCLACHAGDFGLTVNDVRIGGTNVKNAVLAHMGTEAVMGDSHIAGLYDPAGTGVGRCSKCHMPKTSSSAITTAFGTGLKEGDIHNHTFNTIWPSANLRLPFVSGADPAEMANSCYSVGCHNNNPASVGYVSTVAEWSASGHADFTGEPFRHWDADGAVPTSCAKCHSRPGFRDFATDGVVNSAAKLGTKISCGACHTEEGDGTTLWDERATYTALDNVLFPSGRRASLADDSNMCMACHQGRASKVQVDAAIAAGGENNLTFVNNHYFAAAATLFGTEVLGGYEYGDNVYVGRFAHVPERDTCIECHMGRTADLRKNNHTFFPKTEYCVACHITTVAVPDNPADPARFRDIRLTLLPPAIDFNGNGDANEGLYFEIWGTAPDNVVNDNVVNRLLLAIQAYAAAAPPDGTGVPIVYAPGVYPYWFIDTNANGLVDPGEAVFANRYVAFDATLLRAAYNYTVVQNEPCGYIHNARSLLQLLFDSIRDLDPNAVLAPTVLIRP